MENEPVKNLEIISPAQQPSRSRLAVIGVIVLVVLAGLGFGGYALSQKLNLAHIRSGQNVSYKYSTLTNHQIKGAISGTGMSFAVPKELVKVVNSKNIQSPVSLTLEQSSAKATVPVAYVNAIANYTYLKLTVAQQKSFSSSFQNSKPGPSQPKSNTSSVPYQFGLVSLFSKNYSLSSSSASAFKNANISANAWQWDFTATATNPKDKLATVQGKAVAVVGTNTVYYFMVYAVQYNWQHNQSIWQRSIDSLKINQ